MRRLAIGSLLSALLAAYMLQWGAFGLAGKSPAEMSSSSGLRLEAAFVVFAPALVGLIFGSVVLLAPLFGRPREGAGYATIGAGLSLLLLFLLLVIMSGG